MGKVELQLGACDQRWHQYTLDRVHVQELCGYTFGTLISQNVDANRKCHLNIDALLQLKCSTQ